MSSTLRQNSFRLLYYKYKDSPTFGLALVGLVLTVCVMLFSQLAIPQIEKWFSIRDETLRTQERIDMINQNINFMNNIDKSVLNNQFNTAVTALPTEKNFGTIVTALSDAAQNAGISFNDFNFQVGSIASDEGKLKKHLEKNVSTVKIIVDVKGDVNAVNSFLKNIEERLPLAEVTNVERDITNTSITLLFYQKSFPQFVFKDDEAITPLSDPNITLLQKLSTWAPSQLEQREAASDSAVPLFSLF